MAFIILLGLAALTLASVSGFFSVWGLAQTYNGLFWFVIAMGVAIEFGKLVAISFIYRHWKDAPKLLNYYLLVAIMAVMLVTAAGHYGFLTSGYQTDSLPLKQVQAQLESLNGEHTRLIERKTQIDNQISQLPTNSIKGRTQLIRQFKTEQSVTTKRINVLDEEILKLKQQQIVSKAHTGPIVFIAQAFKVDTDIASHYLTLLLIFVFDPLAIALTWAFNVALRLRTEQRLPVIQHSEVTQPVDVELVNEPIPEPVITPMEETIPVELELVPVEAPADVDQPMIDVIPDVPETEVSQPDPISAPPIIAPPVRRRRPYAGALDNNSNDNISELVKHHQYLVNKRDNPTPDDTFSNDDLWELSAIKEALTKAGLNHYLS